MKKICVFCETWASGGIESLLCRLLANMDQTGLQIDLVAARAEDSVFTLPLEQAGIRVRELSGSKLRWFSNCRQFDRLLREQQYDAVHLNVFQGLQLVYLWLAQRAGVPVRIAHSHASGLRRSPLRPAKLLLHSLGKGLFGHCATRRWACSGAAAAFLFSAESHRLPNGLDTLQYRFDANTRKRIRAQLGLEDQFVIGSVGRLAPEKNQLFLLDTLAALLPQRPESVLLLVGDGPQRQALQRRAEALGINGHVLFYGVSDRVQELLWAMDAFAFPSLSEGLGMAAVEAQAAGLPVICSQHIPDEARVTPLFQQLPLQEGAARWAQALANTHTSNRESYAAVVRQAGYELSDVSQTVRAAYLEES